MLSQTLPIFGVNFTDFIYVNRMLKGCFNSNPPKPRYVHTWDISVVLKYLFTLYPLEDLSLKMLTLKLTALLALTTAARAQTLSALNLNFMKQFSDVIIFDIHELLKTTRPGIKQPSVVIKRYDKRELCVFKTLKHYILRTKDVRKTSSLLISYATFSGVTTSTLARWLRTVLDLAGIDTTIFKAHSYRGASTTAAYNAGCSVNNILNTANWSNAKTFRKFYYKETVSDKSFGDCVLQSDCS